jgi:DNA-binding NtrC family response regulator
MIPPPGIKRRADRKLAAFWRAQGSDIVQNMLSTARHFALSDLGIKIVGEKGSGKMPLARFIHQASSRANREFVDIDCAELALREPRKTLLGSENDAADGIRIEPGLLETARGGTLYFDMFQLLPTDIRGLLLKALDMRQFRRIGGTNDISMDVRIIAGMTKGQESATGTQGSEGDVPGRFSPVCINIPPLRERRGDIESLIYLFLEEFYEEIRQNVKGITSEALQVCRYYDWPGNIHELRNVIRHSASRCIGSSLTPEQLPEYLRHEYGGAVARPRVVSTGL